MSINISEKLVLTNKCEPTPILQVDNCDVWNRMIIPSCEDLDTIGLCDKYYDLYGRICEQMPGRVYGCRAMPNTTCVKENCADWNRKITSSCDAISSNCNQYYDNYGRICEQKGGGNPGCHAKPNTTCKIK